MAGYTVHRCLVPGQYLGFSVDWCRAGGQDLGSDPPVFLRLIPSRSSGYRVPAWTDQMAHWRTGGWISVHSHVGPFRYLGLSVDWLRAGGEDLGSDPPIFLRVPLAKSSGASLARAQSLIPSLCHRAWLQIAGRFRFRVLGSGTLVLCGLLVDLRSDQSVVCTVQT